MLAHLAAGAIAALALSAASPAGAAPDSGPPGSEVLVAGFAGTHHAYACGVIIAAGARSITLVIAAHSLDIERPEFITVSGERLRILSAAPVPGHDIAMLTAARPRGGFEVALPAAPVTAGTRLHVWGPIKDAPFTPHTATARAMDERIEAPSNAVAIDCADCDHGDSGTGVFDDDGHLVGIITAGFFEGGRKLLVMVERVQPETVASAVR